MEKWDHAIDQTIAERLRLLRTRQGLTLEGLAARSGVSRAMISRIERAEASPTAALLARLCGALGQSLSGFFEPHTSGSPLARPGEQPVWRDPETGYRRRAVSPPGTGSRIDVVEVEFPPQTRLNLGAPPVGRSQWQHVWVFDGQLSLTVGTQVWLLGPGDCLHMAVADVRAFENQTDLPVRYAVIIDRGGPEPM